MSTPEPRRKQPGPDSIEVTSITPKPKVVVSFVSRSGVKLDSLALDLDEAKKLRDLLQAALQSSRGTQ